MVTDLRLWSLSSQGCKVWSRTAQKMRGAEQHVTRSLTSGPIWLPPNGVVSRSLLCMAPRSLHIQGWPRLCRLWRTRWDAD